MWHEWMKKRETYGVLVAKAQEKQLGTPRHTKENTAKFILNK
jgi:hypothetical protein